MSSDPKPPANEVTSLPSAHGPVDAPIGKRKYHRFNSAAARLQSTADDLLHLGVLGLLDISAPVVASGLFEWPIGLHGLALPEIKEPFIQEFDAASRVFLLPSDLARIEAIGWVIPELFYCPSIARHLVADQISRDALVGPDDAVWESETGDLKIIKAQAIDDQLNGLDPSSDEYTRGKVIMDAVFDNNRIFPPEDPEIENVIRENAFNSLWQAVNQFGRNDEKTTIDHLFISDEELLRLEARQPQDEAVTKRNLDLQASEEKVHGNTTVNLAKRLSVLHAALYLKNLDPKRCGSFNRDWAAFIEQEASVFWTNGPPLSLDIIERLLGLVRDVPKEKYDFVARRKN